MSHHPLFSHISVTNWVVYVIRRPMERCTGILYATFQDLIICHIFPLWLKMSFIKKAKLFESPDGRSVLEHMQFWNKYAKRQRLMWKDVTIIIKNKSIIDESWKHVMPIARATCKGRFQNKKHIKRVMLSGNIRLCIHRINTSVIFQT